MKPVRRLSRRSFLANVGAAAAAGGALLVIAGEAEAGQARRRRTGPRRGVTDRDSGRAADPIGSGRGGPPIRFNDSDHANPRHIGDVFESDPPPGKRTGITDRDSGSNSDPVNYGSQPYPLRRTRRN